MMQAPQRAGDHDAMARVTSAKQFRELRTNARATVLLVRTFTPHLVKAFVESLAVQDRLRARLPSRQRRTSPLKIGLSAVGVVAAGAAAARLAGHYGPFGDGGPDTDQL
jgi:exosome complex RNA-binding protein Csl4